jgi:hypothetical protein
VDATHLRKLWAYVDLRGARVVNIDPTEDPRAEVRITGYEGPNTARPGYTEPPGY